MKIIREDRSEGITVSETMTVEEFADKYGLDLRIGKNKNGLYTCSFDGVEVKDGPILASSYGCASTEKNALQDYISQISEKLIVIGAYTRSRREIMVPSLVMENTNLDN